MSDRMSRPGASRVTAALHSRTGRVAPPLVLMAAIFAASATPDLTTGLGLLDLIGRKLVHAFEYGLLWWLWLSAFGFRRPWLAAAVTLAYAASDEYHQTFVPGRHGTPVDVLVDSAGIPIAWALDRRLRRRGRVSEPAALGGREDGLRAVDRAELPVDVVQVGSDGAGRQGQL